MQTAEIFIIIKAKIEIQEGKTVEESIQDLEQEGDYSIISAECNHTRILDTEWIETTTERPVTILLKDMVEKPVYIEREIDE